MEPSGTSLGGAATKLAAAAAATFVVGVALAVALLTGGTAGVVGSYVANQDVCSTSSSGPATGPGQTYTENEPSQEAIAGIPENYLEAYRDAGEEYGLDWTYIAAVGKVETDHGRYNPSGGCITGPDTAYGNAQGPMQFIPSTWEQVGVDGDGDGQKDPCNYKDAIPAAANYLKQSGAPGDWYAAVFAYNHADWYVDEVFSWADKYRSADTGGGGAPSGEEQQAGQEPSTAEEAFQAGLATVISPFAMSEAHATQNSWDRVDDGMNLHYEESTVYDEALQQAVDGWNALGTINVAPSPSPEETDVWISDGDSAATEGHSGGIAKSDGQIILNSPNMSDNTLEANAGIVGHEIGHSLGFDHPSSDVFSMMTSPAGSDRPTDYDKEEYYARWGEPTEGTPTGNSSGGSGENAQNTSAAFPLPEGSYDYTNDWGADRPTYAGNHEGTDLFADDGTPISSITDGKVVQNEWNELGGWIVMVEATRSIGPVRAGDTLYYAHQLEKSPVGVGTEVKAGEQIGKVGSTGEGPEGSIIPDGRGRHLHLGWYVDGNRAEAESGAKNPYPLLQWLEENGGNVSGGGPLAPTACPEEPRDGPQGGAPLSDPPSGNGGPVQGSGTGKQVVEEARKYLGTPYVLGGPEDCIPNEQMDCTCLTLTVFKQFGFDLPDSPLGQWEYGEPVEGEPQAGDLLVWDDPGDGTGGHAAISLGNGQIIHANTYTMDTSESAHWDTPLYLGARRLVSD